jgi:hypothetical protein
MKPPGYDRAHSDVEEFSEKAPGDEQPEKVDG